MSQRGTSRISAPTALLSHRHTISSSLSMDEGRGLAPLTAEDKGVQGLAGARGQLALTQVIWQPARIVEIADRHHRDRLLTLRGPPGLDPESKQPHLTSRSTSY